MTETPLTHLLRGRGAHADPLAAVEGLDWRLAGRRPPGFTHTVWQLVFHLNYWMDVELRCIETPEMAHSATDAASWPPEAPPDAVTWEHEVALFRTNLAQLDTLARARASTLARIVHRENGATVEAVLWGLVAHNSYHTGQIVQLRQALGAWPPTSPAPPAPDPGSP